MLSSLWLANKHKHTDQRPALGCCSFSCYLKYLSSIPMSHPRDVWKFSSHAEYAKTQKSLSSYSSAKLYERSKQRLGDPWLWLEKWLWAWLHEVGTFITWFTLELFSGESMQQETPLPRGVSQMTSDKDWFSANQKTSILVCWELASTSMKTVVFASFTGCLSGTSVMHCWSEMD